MCRSEKERKEIELLAQRISKEDTYDIICQIHSEGNHLFNMILLAGEVNKLAGGLG